MAPLESECRPPRARDLGTAGAAATMRWEHGDVVRELQQMVAQRFVCRPRELFRELGTEEIDARDLADEERATGEEVLRILRATQIRDEIGDVLRGMPGGRDASHAELT